MALSGVRSSCDRTARKSSFSAVRVPHFAIEAGVLERHRGPRRRADGQAFVLLGKHAGLRVAEEQSAEHGAVDALDRNGEVTLHRQMPGRHAVERLVLPVARILGDVVQAHDALATEGRRKHPGRARMRKMRERLPWRTRQRVEHVRVAGVLIAHVVEERAELGVGELGGGVGHLLDDRFAIERRRDDSADLAQLLRVGARTRWSAPAAARAR